MPSHEPRPCLVEGPSRNTQNRRCMRGNVQRWRSTTLRGPIPRGRVIGPYVTCMTPGPGIPESTHGRVTGSLTEPDPMTPTLGWTSSSDGIECWYHCWRLFLEYWTTLPGSPDGPSSEDVPGYLRTPPSSGVPVGYPRMPSSEYHRPGCGRHLRISPLETRCGDHSWENRKPRPRDQGRCSQCTA